MVEWGKRCAGGPPRLKGPRWMRASVFTKTLISAHHMGASNSIENLRPCTYPSWGGSGS